MATERSLSSVTRQHNITDQYVEWIYTQVGEGENGKTIWDENVEDSVLQISLEPHNTVV